jgi:LysM repeat protein
VVIVILVVLIYGRRPSGTEEAAGSSTDISMPEMGETIPPVSAAEPEPNLLEADLTATAEANPKVEQLIADAMKHIDAKPAKIIEARDRLNETLPLAMSTQQRAFVKERLSELADKWLFSRTIFPEDRLCGAYEVEPGDLLTTIGKQFKVPYEILLEINNISRPEALQAGQTIKVINGPFHARIYRSSFTMDLYLQNSFVRSFPVGLGKPAMETPVGLWAVKAGGKLIKPSWTDPISGKSYESDDPDYPLGSRWVGLEGLSGDAVGRTGFAIHGTKKPDEIGTMGSQGCVRLHNGDAILVYNLLVPVHSRVEIVE